MSTQYSQFQKTDDFVDCSKMLLSCYIFSVCLDELKPSVMFFVIENKCSIDFKGVDGRWILFVAFENYSLDANLLFERNNYFYGRFDACEKVPIIIVLKNGCWWFDIAAWNTKNHGSTIEAGKILWVLNWKVNDRAKVVVL